MELISIIVPVYNVESYLERCINSILNQTYKNLEIVIVNDGSTDQSGMICNRLSKQDSRIKIIHKENGGLSDARNAGLEIASGDFIGFVDSDDWIESDMYECLYDLLCRYNADIAICGSNSVDSEGKVVGVGKFPKKVVGYEDVVVFEDEKIMEAHLEKTNDINSGVWNKLYRKNIVHGIRFPKSKLYEDVFTMYKYLNRAKKVVKTRTHKYNYYQRDDSICRKSFTIKNFDSVQANNERYEFIKANYPNLESMARERLLVNLLGVGFRLAKEGQISEFRVEMLKSIKESKHLSVRNCGLSLKQRWGICLMRINLKAFQIMTKLMYC